MSADFVADNAAGGGAESQLLEKRKSSSIIWKYFGFKKDDVNQSEVLCRSCLGKIVSNCMATLQTCFTT